MDRYLLYNLLDTGATKMIYKFPLTQLLAQDFLMNDILVAVSLDLSLAFII